MANMKSDTVEFVTPTGFKFGATPIDELGASEYTIVGVAVDVSGSVSLYEKELEKCLGTIVDSCRKSPRADNLLLRVLSFNTNLMEIHGFKELVNINPGDYDNALNCNHSTALYDATLDSLESVEKYAQDLSGMDYFSNAILFVITDGEENDSMKATEKMVKDKLEELRGKDDVLESIKVILIGINTDQCRQWLDKYHKNAKFDQFVDVGDVTPGKLAKLAEFVSKSVSSQSQMLGTGGPSQNISMTF